MMALTSGYYYPYKVHEKVITPKIICLWSAISDAFVPEVKHARRIVEYIAVNLTKGYHSLKRMAQRMLSSDQPCHGEGERAPADLSSIILVFFFQRFPVGISAGDLQQLQSPYTERTDLRSNIWNLTWRIPSIAAQRDPAYLAYSHGCKQSSLFPLANRYFRAEMKSLTLEKKVYSPGCIEHPQISIRVESVTVLLNSHNTNHKMVAFSEDGSLGL